MRVGLILNNFVVSKDRTYSWDVISDTVKHYRESLPDVYVTCCASGTKPDSDCDIDLLYMGSPANSIQSNHNNPKLIRAIVKKCDDVGCDKILFVSPYYRVKNFDFLDEGLSVLIEENVYAEDLVKSKELSFDFLCCNTKFIRKALTKRPWNYNLATPSQNLFESIYNIVGAKKILNQAKFLTKKDLAIEQAKVFWRSNIKYTQH